MEKENNEAALVAPRKDGDFLVTIDMKDDSVHPSFESAFRRLHTVISEMTMSGKGSRMLIETTFIERYFLRDGRLKFCPMTLPGAVNLAHEAGMLTERGESLVELNGPIDKDLLDRHYEMAAEGFLEGACEFFGVGTSK